MKIVAVVLCLPLSQVQAQLAAVDDAQFRAQYQRQYQRIGALRPDMLVEELRLRVELVASRGSQVGAASNDRRVRGFESALLQSLQGALCGSGQLRPAPPTQPAAPVIESVTAAANAQRLRTVGADVAELSALAQRLVDSQAARWCTLQSLDDVQ
ncbi:MAG: hypothetical protein ACREWG_12990 [Gammaproteobacteria bacterium]